MKTMIWCTCAEDNKEVYLQRIKIWYYQAKVLFGELNPDYYVFVDGEVDCTVEGLNIVNIKPKLGRKNVVVFPGWKRSFKTSLEYGRNYDCILHVENDVRIFHSKKILEYLTKPGYYLGWCKKYGFIETAFMILNDKQLNQKFIEQYSNEDNLYKFEIFEHTFERIAHKRYQLVFDTDRIEGDKNRINFDYDYVCQIF